MKLPRLAELLELPFAPAIAVLNRLTFGRKFALIALLLSGPLAVLFFLQYSNSTEGIDFSARERVGIAYLAPTYEFLDAVQRHRVLRSAALAGSSEAGPQVDRSAAEADAAADRVDEIDARDGVLLRTRDEWRSIHDAWRRLRSTEDRDPQASDEAHGKLTTRLVSLIIHRVGNYSNLILDPDLDSYWLMDAFVIKIPALADTISAASAHWARVEIPEGPVADGLAFAGDLRMELVAARELADVDLATVFRETAQKGQGAELRLALEGPLAAAEQSIEHHADLLRQALAMQSPTPPRRADVVVAATTTLDRLAELHRRVGPQLDRLVEGRLLRHQTQRRKGVLAAGALAAVLGYLFIGVYLSVHRSVTATLGPRAGEAREPHEARPASLDELGQMAVAYTRERGEKRKLEEQLVLADRLATIGTLAAGTAHEINEPLGAVLGFAQLAQKTPNLPESTTRDLQKITKAALHAREVIKQLMLFAHQTPPHKELLDLRQAVQESLEVMQPRCDKEGITLVRDFQDAPQIIVDRSQMRQVVMNLVVNAVQASTAGSEVRVGVLARPDHVVLFVEDRGTGMTEEVRKQIFLPFYTTNEIGKGTGLGLSVVHGIVTAHGGTIQVESTPGLGTRFEVQLPLPPPNAATA